jgi:hypothetical protein
MALQIRRQVYRNREGFLICGRSKNHPTSFPIRIFTETRISAEHIRAKINRGEQTTTEDFHYGEQVRASVRVDEKHNYLVVKCPRGHLISATKLDSSFGGSHIEAIWGSWQAGRETGWDRQARDCRGTGCCVED